MSEKKPNPIVLIDRTDGEVLAPFDPDACQHPNIIFEDDQFDEDGNRISKHHWYCPDCDFLQVG